MSSGQTSRILEQEEGKENRKVILGECIFTTFAYRDDDSVFPYVRKIISFEASVKNYAERNFLERLLELGLTLVPRFAMGYSTKEGIRRCIAEKAGHTESDLSYALRKSDYKMSYAIIEANQQRSLQA